MYSHYLKLAFRILSRRKVFTCINVAGLSLCLAYCIMLSRYLYREAHVDSHMIHSESVRVINRVGDQYSMLCNKAGLVECFEPSFKEILDKEIVESSLFVPKSSCPSTFDGRERIVNVLAADSLLLHFFDYKIEGDIHALSRPEGCWLSRHLLNAIGLPLDSVMGKPFRINNLDFIISGVFEEPQGTTILKPDVMASIYALDYSYGIGNEWLRMREGCDVEAFNQAIMTYEQTSEDQHFFRYSTQLIDFELISWKDYYYSENTRSSMESHGNANLNRNLFVVMLLLLIVGMTSFINLHRVNLARRQREEGVRKVFGQNTLHLFLEQWTELILQVSTAVFIAWILVALLRPYEEVILGYSADYSMVDVILSAGMLVLLPMLTLVLSVPRQMRCSPFACLQQRAGSEQSIKECISVLSIQYMITFTILFFALWLQCHFRVLLESPVGFDVENILVAQPLNLRLGISIGEDGESHYKSNMKEVGELAKILIDRLSESPAIEKITIAEKPPIVLEKEGHRYFCNDKDEKKKLILLHVGPNWFDVFGIPVKQGRLFSGIPANERRNFIDQWVVDEGALKVLGYDGMDNAYIRAEWPLRPFGDLDDFEKGIAPLPVGGVVGSHYAQHHTLGVSACIYWIDDVEKYISYRSRMFIRVKPGQNQAAIGLLEKACQEICPEHELEYHWFREDFEKIYNEDRKMAEVCLIGSFIAVLICCLGLLGLSLFDIRQRYREIAIRKAHGAHRKDLYLLLGRKYIYVLLITFALSIPITYLLIHHYTESFVESAPLTPIIYIEALGIVSLITMLTLVYQLERAARVNVASVMKAE